MFIKQITIKNYKCFEDQAIDLGTPTGRRGSGLTILIGENGTGKTTILESINLLTQSIFITENKLTPNDFNNYKEMINISGKTEAFNCKMPYPENYFEANGINFEAKTRNSKKPGKLLSTGMSATNSFNNIHNKYKNSKDEFSTKAILGLHKIFNPKNIIENDINIFFFAKNRTKHVSTGGYSTTLEKITEDLNWRFLSKMTDETSEYLTQEIAEKFFSKVLETAMTGTGKKIDLEKVTSMFSEFFDDDELSKVKLDLLTLLKPFTKGSFVQREANSTKQIPLSSLGSGLEMIFTILLLTHLATKREESLILLIDEPELHLHPKAQTKLLETFLKYSKNIQIVLTTHSPYMYQNIFDTDAKLLTIKKSTTTKIEINDTEENEWGLFGRKSPTWGEINYYAYNLPTVEFHNELYGYLQVKAIIVDEDNCKEQNFDNFIQNKLGTDKEIRDWYNDKYDEEYPRTIQTYIRNSIHHPENTTNDIYTTEDLKKSTEQLIKIIKQ